MVARATKEEIYENSEYWGVKLEEKEEMDEVSLLADNMEDMGLNLSPIDLEVVECK